MVVVRVVSDLGGAKLGVCAWRDGQDSENDFFEDTIKLCFAMSQET
jgi:hypothetical protein